MEIIDGIFKKYGISEEKYGENISRDHQRMMQDKKEQSEHMAKKKR